MRVYTHGEWSINEWPQRDNSIRIGAPGTPVIAEVPLKFVSINEQRANAKLIAAAKHMFEALQRIYVRSSDPMISGIAMTAITKAEWKEQDATVAELPQP